MRNYIFIITLFLIYSCKDNRVITEKEKINNEKRLDSAVQRIGNLYQPERMTIKGNRIGSGDEEEDYTAELTNSDLLDSSSENVEKHAEKIALIYCKYLTKSIKPFNFKRIIIKINHKKAKSEVFEYSIDNISQLLNLD